MIKTVVMLAIIFLTFAYLSKAFPALNTVTPTDIANTATNAWNQMAGTQ